MALTVTRITVATPTLDAITLGAGGSLVVGTTYYYRLVAVRNYGNKPCLSAASAEQAVTPTTGNQTAQLTWSAVANATSYIVQRTTTSGSYPLSGTSCFSLKTQNYSSYIYSTTLLYLNDDNGATSNLQWNAKPLDFDTEHAIIEADGGGTGTTVTLYDIAANLAGGGFTDLQLLGSSVLQADANWRVEGFYQLRGTLLIKNCTFNMQSNLTTYGGDLVVYKTCIVQIGHQTTRYYPKLIRLGMPIICWTTNNSTFTSSIASGGSINAKAGETNYVNLYIDRPVSNSAIGNYVAGADARYTAGGSFQNIIVNDTILGAAIGNTMGFFPYATSLNNVLEGVRVLGSPILNTYLQNASYNSTYWAGNLVVQGCTTYKVSIDFQLWYSVQLGLHIIDHNFKGRAQTDNQPYIYVAKMIGGTATSLFSVTRNFLILDEFGNPISGANVEITNANGLGGFWDASGATFSTAINETDDTPTMTVSNGALFTVGDYIRCECYSEVLRVTNIAANVLTVSRAHFGTSKRKTNNTANSVRVMKMVTSRTTDANGKITCTEPILQRELLAYNVAVLAGTSNWENTLVSASNVQRFFIAPYTVKISKAGFKSYRGDILDPDVDKFPLGPQTIEVALSKVKDLSFSKHVKRMSQ